MCFIRAFFVVGVWTFHFCTGWFARVIRHVFESLESVKRSLWPSFVYTIGYWIYWSCSSLYACPLRRNLLQQQQLWPRPRTCVGLANIAPVSLDSGHPQNENKNFFKQYGIAFEFGMFSQAFLSIKIHHIKVFKNQFFCLVLGWGPFGDGKHQRYIQ